MKKNIKKIIPIIALASLMSTTAFANDLNNDKTPVAKVQDATKMPNSIFVNGKLLENVNTIKENGKTLFPVRAVFEKMDFVINYDAKTKTVSLTKAPQFITFSTISDAYTFSKMAPQPLGQKPIVKDGVTYVPVELLNLIQMEYTLNDNGSLVIGDDNITKSDTIEIIAIDKDKNTITVKDSQKGEVVLNIKDLNIDYTTDDKELLIGQNLEVVYGDTMTASQPPMNNPKSVKVVDKISHGQIISVEKDSEGNMSVLYKDNELGEIKLNVPKDMKIDYTTLAKELKAGQEIEVVLGKAMTMSIPPMNNPKSIKVVKSSSDENQTENKAPSIKGTATIKSVDKENKQVLVVDEKLGEVVLNLNDDLVVEYKNKNDLNAYNWLVVGQKLEVEYSPVMTKSLPPINNPIKIVVLN